MTTNETPAPGTNTAVGATQPNETPDKSMSDTATTTSPVRCNDTEKGPVTTHGDDTATVNDVTPETARDHNAEAATANETTKTEYTEEQWRAGQLQRELWQSGDGHDFRQFVLPDRARSRLLEYGSLGREIMLRALLETETSIQVYFGYRQALVAEFWPVGIYRNDNPFEDYESPNNLWELQEYRWKSEEGREVVRQAIDEYLELAESGFGAIYIETFLNDVERPPSTSDIS